MAHVIMDSQRPYQAFTVLTATTGPFGFTFPFIDASDIKVYRVKSGVRASLESLGISYTVTGAAAGDGGFNGGTVILGTAQSNCAIWVERHTDPARLTDFPNSAAFRPNALNSALDRLHGIAVEHDDILLRSIRAPVRDGPLDMVLPPAVARAGQYLKFNSAGQPEVGVGPNVAESLIKNRLYVSKSGADANDGQTWAAAKASIKAACERAQELIDAGEIERCTILVATGHYIESCPITVPPKVAIMGDALRSVLVQPSVATSNVFRLHSHCYVGQLWVYGHQLSPTAFDITPTGYAGFNGTNAPRNTEQTGWAFSFAPGASIQVSPYIQNVTSVSGSGTFGQPGFVPGGGGVLVDPSTCVEGNLVNSIVLDAFTQVNLGGIGSKVVGLGYMQQVSFFKNFCQFGILCVDGGHITALNSNSSFGNYALWAEGSRQIQGPSGAEDFGSLIEASGYTLTYAGAGLDYSQLPYAQGGTGVEDTAKYFTELNGGRIYSTVTDNLGDFYVGTFTSSGQPKFRINQRQGIIEGRAFYQSVFGFMAPLVQTLFGKR